MIETKKSLWSEHDIIRSIKIFRITNKVVSCKPILATAVEGAFGVIADLMDTAGVCFKGTLVDI